MARAQADNDYGENQAHFAEGDQHLNTSADFYAEIIHSSQSQDQHHRQNLAEVDFERHAGRAERYRDVSDGLLQLRMKIREIEKKCGGQGGDGAALGDPHLRPAVNKAPQRSVRFAQIDILTARAGHSRGQLGIRQCSG